MAKKDARKPLGKKQARTVALVLLALSLVISALAVTAAAAPRTYDVKLGEPSPATVYAPYDAEDEAATELMRKSAESKIENIYSIDEATVSSLIKSAGDFFTAVAGVKKEAGELLLQLPPEAEATLGEEDIARLAAMTAPPLTENMVSGLVQATSYELQNMRDVVMSKLTISLESGLSEEARDGVLSSCVREINAMSGISAPLKQIAAAALDAYLKPSLALDLDATQSARAEATKSVVPVMIQRGAMIAERGKAITESQLALLEGYGLVDTGEKNVALFTGELLILLTGYLLFTLFLYTYKQREVFGDVKRMAIIAVLLMLATGLQLLAKQVDIRLTPMLFSVMLTALLVGERTALAMNILLALTAGLMAGGRAQDASSTSAFAVMLTNMACGATSVFVLRKTQSRSALIAAGAVGAFAGILVTGSSELIAGNGAIDILISSAWIAGSAMVMTLLVTGSLTIWENLFDIATSAKLNELSNTNHPLLKQLMTEAPGTYQHSVMVAALAEAAAERIGADALLARVGGYFHDVGKLRRPLYFMENQKNGENIHDTLPPLESAQTIISHQKDGVYYLNRAKLPSAVVRICSEHHGNSLMTYFYAKAKKEDPNVNPKQFRYPGNKPSSKESAIVMMADSCEAAVRSLGDTNSEAVEQMVHKVIWSKLDRDDNMMANAPLTIADINDIEKSFIRTLGGLMHDRIEYPDMSEIKAAPDERSTTA